MREGEQSTALRLNLKAGEWVEIRSQVELLATVDERGCLENLPLMPEMLQYCGKRFRVFKRADKTCDNIEPWSIRRMKDAVHLEGLRCDGSKHGECEAGCLIFWKEAWLRRVGTGGVFLDGPQSTDNIPAPDKSWMVNGILAASQATNPEGEVTYFCQATEVLAFTSYMQWWDPRQYVRDLRSGNLSSGLARHLRSEQALDRVLGAMRLFQSIIIDLFNRIQSKRSRSPYPFIAGLLDKTPIELLDLQPGEFVQVRSKEEIVATLDPQNRNRGLLFDSEMLLYCGGLYKVLRPVHKIIDEKTGKMMHMKYPCIVLEGVVCKANYHRLCPRAIYSYWREAWLKRVSPNSAPAFQEIETEHPDSSEIIWNKPT